MYIFKKEENITFQNTIASNQALIAIQTKYIEQLKDTYQALRILKHDMHSYFHNIEYLLKMKNYTELENLITELKIVTSSSILSTCSNTYIAATIYPFLSTMEQNQIVFHFNYQVFQDINMKNIELCALFYNLLKNAVEANQNNKEYKEITLEISRKHSSMLINLTNTISSTFSLKQIKNKQTLKDNKLEHGLGLISIEKIVNTYHGDISYDVKNNTLHTSIVLLNIFDI